MSLRLNVSAGSYNVRASELCQDSRSQIRHLRCHVHFLDDTESNFDIDRNAKGQQLLDRVYEHLELIEKDFFGLQFVDDSPDANVMRWLDPLKPLKRQMIVGPPFVLYFRVKFFVADPSKLREEYTRYHFFLQIKRDILEGRFVVPYKTAVLLASYAVQAELGDYNTKEHSNGYLSVFRFIPGQTAAFEQDVSEMHRQHRHQTPADAEYNYLDHVRRQDMYGVDIHRAQLRDKGAMEVSLGVTSTGLVVFQNQTRISTYQWTKIVKISFKRRLFSIQLRRDSTEGSSEASFITPSYRCCKNLWKSCVEHHTFFRLHTPPPPRTALFSFQSKFRFSGRTEYESLEESRKRARTARTFTRTPSKHYARRTIGAPSAIDREHQIGGVLPIQAPLTSSLLGGGGDRWSSNGGYSSINSRSSYGGTSNSTATERLTYSSTAGSVSDQRLNPYIRPNAPNGNLANHDGPANGKGGNEFSSLRRRGSAGSSRATTASANGTERSSRSDLRSSRTDNRMSRSYEPTNRMSQSMDANGLTHGKDATDCTPTSSLRRKGGGSSANHRVSQYYNDNSEYMNGNGNSHNGNLVTIRMKADSQGRFGFNVKGGADLNQPVIVSRVAPHTPADLCIPRLNEGDQILLINGRDISKDSHDQVVQMIRDARQESQKDQELVLEVLTNVYIADDVPDEPDFQYVPDSHHHMSINTGNGSVGGADLLPRSLRILQEGIDNGTAVAKFEQLFRKKSGLTMNVARLQENQPKNRYRDISPYDQTRVKLKSGAGGVSGDYINANYVNMEVPRTGIVNRYIAAQGPLPNTSGDFWQMVWEQRSSLVVMLTVEAERGRVKCHQYWPRKGSTVVFGRLSLTCTSEDISPSFAFRDFVLCHSDKPSDKQQIRQMQYISWPDHGVPEDCTDFLDFVLRVRKYRTGMVEPTVVHCSAGIGRTGVLILMETAMCLIETNQPVYPLDIVKHMREQRAMMIQTASQYKFVCEAILKVYNDKIIRPSPEFK